MSLRFGTDGIRGVAGTELTPELVMALGRAAARSLVSGSRVDGSPTPELVVGRDTRQSGPMLQAAFSAGVAAEGVDVVDLGVLPSPGVAEAAAERGSTGAIVSASHNPYRDNGIKLLGPGGRKLTDAQERQVEAELERLMGGDLAPAGPAGGAGGSGIGTIRAEPEALGLYCEKVIRVLQGRSLRGATVVVDCANGAATETAPRILREAGAKVVAVLSSQPDGTNINDGCGSTHPNALMSAVVEHGASVGLALDGDADRVIAVDERGQLVDGDRLLALFAIDMKSRGLLTDSTVVVTVMTNLGFHQAMGRAGIHVHETPVGDRHVLAAIDDHGWDLGGEQSGHLIFRRHAATGDGVMTGLFLLDLLSRAGGSLHDMAQSAMTRLPQVIRNVAVTAPKLLAGSASVWDEVRAVEADLGGGGRVLLRPSGTEPVVRVMVEAPTLEQAEEYAGRLARAVAGLDAGF